MTTLTIETPIKFRKTKFKNLDELYNFIQDFYLKEKLEQIDNESSTGELSIEQSDEFLDNLFEKGN